MANITSFSIPLNEISASGETRTLTIAGEVGAKFILQVASSVGTFYNFPRSTFASNFHSRNRKIVTMTSDTYSTIIRFPATADITYNVMIIAYPDSDTEIMVGSEARQTLTRQVSSVANSVVTFALKTANSSSYETLPSNITSTGSPATSGSVSVDLGTSWLVQNKEDDTYGFGLKFVNGNESSGFFYVKPTHNAWFFETTETVDGTTSSSTSVVVDDITDLAVGMEMTYKASASDSGGLATAAAGTTITAIDEASKTLTLSVANSLTDGNTMTFRAYGFTNINNALDMNLTFGKLVATAQQFTTQVRADVSASTTVTLTDTYGIAGGNTVTYTGSGVDNSAANAVSTVAEDTTGGGGLANDGEMVVQQAQTLKAKTVLTFTGSYQKVTITGDLKINQYPSSNRIIYLDLDKFLTPGTDGS